MIKKIIKKISDSSAVIVALIALVVSIWQVKLFQNHNKLTVMPYLDSHSIYEDSILTVSFSNKGLGPAIIQEMTYEVNDKEYNTIYELLHSLGEQENIISTYNYSPNSALASGEKKVIVEIKNPKFRGIKVKVAYQSIYKEKGNIEFSF